MSWTLDEPYVEITSLCNLGCTFCYNSSGVNNKHILGLGVLEKCFSYFSKSGIKSISISGGEPLMHPDIINILKRCKYYQFRTLLATNGTLLDNTLISEIMDCVDYYQISIDGDSKTHCDIRGKESYNKAIKGIESLHNLGLSNRTRLRMTISKKNISCIEHLISLGLHYELEAVQFSIVRRQGRAKEKYDNEFSIDDDLLYDAFVEINEFRKKYKDKINIGRLEVDGGSCSLTNDNTVIKPKIDSRGIIFPCHGFSLEEHSLGNLSEGLEKVFSLSRINSYLDILKNTREECKECNRCFWNKVLCKRGCPAQAYSWSGDIRGVDGLCGVRNKIWRDYIFKNN